MDRYTLSILPVAFLVLISSFCFGQKKVLDSSMHSLRNGETREWSEFPTNVTGKQLTLKFDHHANQSAHTLHLRQYDVKQTWRVAINNHDIGLLVSDEKDMMTYLDIPSGVLQSGENELTIKCQDVISDDIKVGEITVDSRPLDVVLAEATVDVSIIEEGTNLLTPGRITIVNARSILQTVSSLSKENLAIRPGYVYTGNGKAQLQLPAGTYILYAGRGFEYGIDSIRITLKPGDHAQKTFRIKREVDTKGWISSDTHVHTVTYSGHGDATAEERVITIAGEGIDLPILTDHNKCVDLKPVAEAKNVLSYFTSVVGDELTTNVGHFNVFELTTGMPVIDHNVENWNQVIANIGDKSNDKVIILNHARDIHNGFRPFDPARHLSSAGTSAHDWKFPANAMEVINSGSQQSEFMNLYHDWFGMLNRGYFLAPIGSSDSHDVSCYTVGQGRTYVQSRVDDPVAIDIAEATKNVREGRVMVSLGLLTKIVVNEQYGPGDIVPGSNKVNVALEVLGPGWTRVARVTLYSNGKKIREEKIDQGSKAGIKWKGSWTINIPDHDVFLVAIAEGPGEGMPYWPIAKPYQPSSPNWRPLVLGSTGAVWIDADRNGKRNSAHDYAVDVLNASDGDIDKIVKRLSSFDEAVAMQIAALLWKDGKTLTSNEISNSLKHAAPATKLGFERMIREIAKIQK
jgi:predicted metal-dependent phosphoesterase TrpH